MGAQAVFQQSVQLVSAEKFAEIQHFDAGGLAPRPDARRQRRGSMKWPTPRQNRRVR